MAFIDRTKANYSFKVLQGKAHTANDRELSNESISSGLILSSNRIFANVIHETPGNVSNVGIVSDLITLIIKPIAGSDGQNLGTWAGYRCYLEGVVPPSLNGVINPLTGVVYALGDVVGNIVPQAFGLDFRPILYSNSSATVEIPPSDASDWFIDPFAGVVTQEADDISNMFKTSTSLNGTHNGRVKAYIYIGEYVIDLLSGSASVPTATNKNMSCSITINDGDEAVSIPITYTPSSDSYVEVLLNGVQLKIEDSASTGGAVISPCYFSNDGGVSHSIRSVRLVKDIESGDKLYWVGSVAGYNLDIDDKMDWNYVIFTTI